MSSNLAIICPRIGTPSETFIHRHIRDLYPGKTVVVAEDSLDAKNRAWDADCPLFLMREENAWLQNLRSLGRLAEHNLFFKKGLSGVDRFLRANNVKVVLGEFLDVSWPFLSLLKDGDIKFFAHAHGCDLSMLYKYAKWRRRYSHFVDADGLIVVNHVMKERLLSIGIPPDKIHYIPYGVDVPDAPRQPRTTAGCLRCVSVGRMVPKKAPLKLLEAFHLATLNHKSLHLDYIGSGPMLNSVKHFIEEHDLTGHVTLHGERDHDYVLALMNRSDLFLQHSMIDPTSGDEEGLPLAILEAMTFALPVVSTRHAGISDAVVDGETGFLVEEGDCSSMAQSLISLTDNATMRLSMGFAGWERARNRFSWNREKSDLLSLMNLHSTVN